MPDSEPAERPRATDDQPPFGLTAESQFLDRLIDWAVGRGDAAADRIYAYLSDRPAEPQPLAAPARHPRRSAPYLARASGAAAFASRSQYGCIPRLLGERRQRRLPG